MMNSRYLTQDRIDYLKKDYQRGFVDFCGFKAIEVTRGRFVSRLDINDNHRQQDGFIHAGVMATMSDHTAGYSAFTIVSEDLQILSIEFKINFLRPAYGNALVCRSTVIREGRRIIIAESDVFDIRGEDDGEHHVSKAIVTLTAVPAKDLKR
jgi:uncharacterized protein (TIGR00369 family)